MDTRTDGDTPARRGDGRPARHDPELYEKARAVAAAKGYGIGELFDKYAGPRIEREFAKLARGV